MAAQKKAAKIQLKGDLAVHNAAALQDEMLSALSKSDSVTVDFSALEDMDVAVLQLLAALVLEAKLKKKEVTFTGVFSPSVKQCFAVAGFIASEHIPDDQVYVQFAQKAGKVL